MDNITKLLEQLKNNDKIARYDACEELRVTPSLPDKAIHALEDATHDPDELVADAAIRALQTHQQNKTPQSTNQIQSQHHQLRKSQKQRSASKSASNRYEQRSTVQMPDSPPNSQQYILALEKRIMYLEVENERLYQAIKDVPEFILPNTQIISPDFLRRAFAIWGHYFVAQLIIGLIIYGLILLTIVFGS